MQNVSGTTYDQTYGFGWSPASQLLTRTASNALYKWTTLTPGTMSSAYDGLGRDAAIVTAGGYDARGNLTGDGTASYQYDVENRLTQVVRGGTTVSLAYDPAGRLSTMTVPGSTTFLYDSDRLVAEYNGSGTVLRRYVHGPGVDEPLVWYEGAGTATRRWLHADRQGSIIAYSSSSGAVSATTIYRYGPWGEPDDGFAAGKSRFRYTGQIMLPEARLYYYKARVYDPLSGRFLQTDPIGYKDDLNLYAYVGGDPVGRTDPTGLYRCEGGQLCDRFAKDLATLREIAESGKLDGDLQKTVDKALAAFDGDVIVSFGKIHGGRDFGVTSGNRVKIDYGKIDGKFGRGSFAAKVEGVATVAHEGRHAWDVSNNSYRDLLAPCSSGTCTTVHYFRAYEVAGFLTEYAVYSYYGYVSSVGANSMDDVINFGNDAGNYDCNTLNSSSCLIPAYGE